MKCRLCQKERDLCKSHIIPEFLYCRTYDDKHRYVALKQGKDQPQYIQKGFYEHLLCLECERLLDGRYESYFARLWYRSKPLPNSTNRKLINYNGLDYARFKLFHLSILWRASVSSLDLFSMISLGTHEDIIRNMLLTADPKTQSDYQILGAVMLQPASTKILHDLIVSPTAQTIDGVPVYMFTFGGCVWYYVLATRPTRFSKVALKSHGQLTLGVVDLRAITTVITHLQDFMRHYAETSSAP